MKRFLTILFLLCAVEASAQTYNSTAIWTTDANPFGGDGTGVLTQTISTGQTVCPHFTIPASNRTVSSVVDDGGNTYNLVITGEESGTWELWVYCSYTTASATSITVTLSSAATGGVLASTIFTNTDSADAIGGSSFGETTTPGTSFSPGSVTVAAPSSVIYGFTWLTAAATSLAIDAEYTVSGVNTTIYAGGYKSVSANDTMDNFTVAQNRVGASAAWEIIPAAAVGGTKKALTLGVGEWQKF